MNVADTKDITVLSLCTGYGGIELGLSRALAKTLRVVAVEIEAYALANLVAKTEEGKLAIEALWPDLKTFPAERFRGCFDFVTGGYPCQPFSCAGKRQGESDPRHLWPDIARIVQAVKPVWCFFENVPGHLTIGFPSVYRSLRNMGYSVEAGLFTAAECGAPHQRKRLFILANRCSERQLFRRMQPRNNTQISSKGNKGGPTSISSNCDKWPARPGQSQYEWEEPRIVVAQSKCAERGSPEKGGNAGARQEKPGIERTVQGQAQSRMGRTTHGPANRVDRLRLLGNGCVPQQVAKAFEVLYEKQIQTTKN